MTSSTFRTDALPAGIVRLWRCRPWSSSPLMRWPERARFTARLIAGVMLLAAVPLAGAVGTISYTDEAALIGAERRDSAAVTAVVVAPPDYGPAHVRRAQVSWTTQAGTVVATVPVSSVADEGDRITVWLNRSGEPVRPPREQVVAVFTGIGSGVVVLVCAGLAGWGLISAAERLIGWQRGRVWDREASALSW
ncbi:Rv1733c family protein [Nocardia asteroides]